MKKIFLLLPLITLIFVCSAPTLAQNQFAASSISLTALPPRLGDDLSLIGEPGSVIRTQVRVRNTSAQALLIETKVEDFTIDADGKTPLPVEGQISTRWSLANWIILPNTPVQVQPNTTAPVPFTISIPNDALPGGHYAMVMHQPVLPSQTNGGEAAIAQRVGTLVYVKVPGEITEEAHLRNIRVPGFSQTGPVSIAFDIENLSSIHIRPQTTVKITNFFGKTVETLTVPSENVFPLSLRTFTTQWARKWAFGQYTVSFSSAYGEQGKTAVNSVKIWIIPYMHIAGGILIVALAYGCLLLLQKNHTANQVSPRQRALLEDRLKQVKQERREDH